MLGDATAPKGTCFGPYEVVAVLGAGGMGTVYEGRHRTLGKRVAIKTLHAPLASDATVVARFVREARAASLLSHPNVADIYDVGVEAGQPYLVMELLRGENLRELIDREGRLSPARALALLCPVAAALDSAHREGVVHRDVKPENIFLSQPRVGPPVPKLLDFGIAKLREEGGSLTSNSDVFGTPYYMSPEQTRGAKHVDARSDQYSLAAVLYECITGARPYEAEHMMALVFQIQMDPPRLLRSIVPEIPEGLEAAILVAMARDPSARFRSTAAFAAALLPFADAATRAYWSASLDVSAESVPVRAGEPHAEPEPLTERYAPRAAAPARGGAIVTPAFTPVAWSATRFEARPLPDRLRTGIAIGGVFGAVLGMIIGGSVIGLVAGRARRVDEPRSITPEVVTTPHAMAPSEPPLATAEPQTPAPASPLPSAPIVDPRVPAQPAASQPSVALAIDAGPARAPLVLGAATDTASTRRVRTARTAPVGPRVPAAASTSIGSNRAPILR